MKSLLTILNHPESVDPLKSALVLQKTLGARLTVAYPVPPLPTAATMFGDGLAAAVIASSDIEYSPDAARQAFDALCKDPSCRFRETDMSPFETLRKYSLFADLVVLGRDDGLADTSLDQLRAALVTNRAPTVWLPRAPLAAAPRSVVCVWNGQAPSARAICSARPFMSKAERVIIVEHAGNEVNRSRLEYYLDTHGIRPAAWQQYGDAGLTARGRARALLAEAAAAGGELLVMGAYGEAAESFFSFGRATEKVASAATVPVLFHS
jgi:nucleotide-binding universal stress UspA family protein